MDKWKKLTIVLTLLLFFSIYVAAEIYNAADKEISSLQVQLNQCKHDKIPGVYYYNGYLSISNENVSSVDIKPMGVSVSNGGRSITVNSFGDVINLDVVVVGGSSVAMAPVWHFKEGARYVCVRLDRGDGLTVSWKVVKGDSSDWKVRVFNETGFEVYKKVIQNFDPTNPSSHASLTVVEMNYQLIGSTGETQKEGTLSVGADSNGKYCVAFENWGSGPLDVRVSVVAEKRINIVDNG